jgi:hypothetical protein
MKTNRTNPAFAVELENTLNKVSWYYGQDRPSAKDLSVVQAKAAILTKLDEIIGDTIEHSQLCLMQTEPESQICDCVADDTNAERLRIRQALGLTHPEAHQ